jgi:hypothetical protein
VDGSGTPCTTCPSDTDLVFWGIVYNRGSTACSITTPTSCLLDSLEVEPLGSPHGGDYRTPTCEEAETVWELPAFGSQADSLLFGELSAGDWVAAVGFSDPVPGLAEAVFTVE